MVELDIEVNDELINVVNDLALRCFGDVSDVSRARVVEAAFQMRYLWSRLVEGSEKEIEEPLLRFKESGPTPLWDGFWKDILRR